MATENDYLNPIYPEMQGLERQRKMAQMLLQQGYQQNAGPAGQMVSGRYVPNSFWQNAQGPVNMMLGAYLDKKSEERAMDLAKQIREAKTEKEQKITDYITGTPEVKTELAGPYAGNVPKPIAIKAETKPDLAAALREISTNNPYGAGSEYKAAIVGNMIPKTPDEVAKYKFAQTPEGGNFKGSFNDFQNQMNAYQKAHLGILAANQANSRVPMGYRMTPTGTLEAIPGGPADLKVQTKLAGANDVDLAVNTLRDKYTKLNDLNAIQNTEKSWLQNLEAGASSSDWGQAISNKLGTQAASARNSIAMERPKLLAAIQKATGMSAKQIDSNAELKLWLNAATDPKKDFASNMEALDNIERSLGSLSIQNSGSLPSESSIDAEIERRKKKK